jgi:hypothetical protein
MNTSFGEVPQTHVLSAAAEAEDGRGRECGSNARAHWKLLLRLPGAVVDVGWMVRQIPLVAAVRVHHKDLRRADQGVRIPRSCRIQNPVPFRRAICYAVQQGVMA